MWQIDFAYNYQKQHQDAISQKEVSLSHFYKGCNVAHWYDRADLYGLHKGLKSYLHRRF